MYNAVRDACFVLDDYVGGNVRSEFGDLYRLARDARHILLLMRANCCYYLRRSYTREKLSDIRLKATYMYEK